MPGATPILRIPSIGSSILLRIDISVQHLLDTSFLMGLCIGAILLFILFYLWLFLVVTKKTKQLQELYRPLISEAVIAETAEELNAVLTSPGLLGLKTGASGHRVHQKVFTQELLMVRKNVSGIAGENLTFLYEALGLQASAQKRLRSSKWHLQAAAIQELSLMNIDHAVALITPLVNHPNFHVRTEAQIALVKLTGFEGFRFLDVLEHPLTLWQQVCLLQQHCPITEKDYAAVSRWLQSANESVVSLALKITEVYRIHAQFRLVQACLDHGSAQIRLEAARTLTMIEPEETTETLVEPTAAQVIPPLSPVLNTQCV